MVDVCCMQALSGQATKCLSFAYKLRSPEDVVLNQYHALSASSKDPKYDIQDLHCLAVLDLLQGMIFQFHIGASRLLDMQVQDHCRRTDEML